MKCKLCGKFFSYETSFKNLFKNYEICEECKLYYTPKLSEENIPIDYGNIRYLYLYDELKINVIQNEYLLKHFHILYNEIEPYFDSIILIMDHLDFENIQKHIQLIIAFRQVVFVSLVRCNIEKLMNFL